MSPEVKLIRKVANSVSCIDVESLSQVVPVRIESGSPRQARTAAGIQTAPSVELSTLNTKNV